MPKLESERRIVHEVSVSVSMTPRSWRSRYQWLQDWPLFVTTPAAEMDPLAMPQRTLPTNVAGNPTPSAQRTSPPPRATSSTAVVAGFRDTTDRWQSMVTTT